LLARQKWEKNKGMKREKQRHEESALRKAERGGGEERGKRITVRFVEE
jgi:hypothetical protein